ncbi:MAG: exodeoxyribonuclease VII large subunit [Oscillospiraceae bacterium]|nr:exodeoxyribonuclease VII large subunit [Oscillospiraceae bacterium]
MERQIYDVSQVNAYIKRKLDSDALLGEICIRGELSNYKVYPSGHHYFTMKDGQGALKCVMFRGAASALRFRPEDGMKVIAVGRITVYERDGAYQLYCNELVPEGTGDLYAAFEQLKKKLSEEGLFAAEHKKPLPRFPHRIAIITSSAGAALHDMLRILGKRYPLSKVVLLPVRVQGAEAPAEICGAIRYANRWNVADVIITGRGGGSIEDLWAFNDERVAREIYQSEIPVISAVGHEPDVTISDYVADLRAATPSNAAELVTPDAQELLLQLRQMQGRMEAAMKKQTQLCRQHLDALAKTRVLQNPLNYLQDRRIALDHAQQMLALGAQRAVEKKKQQFGKLAAGLDAMSPLKVLGRGYVMAKDEKGELVTSVHQVKDGDRLIVRMQDGALKTRIEGKEQQS